MGTLVQIITINTIDSSVLFAVEILIMLLVAFAFGYVFKAVLKTETSNKIETLQQEITNLKKAPVVEKVVYKSDSKQTNVSEELYQLKSELAVAKAQIASMSAEPNNSATLENLNREYNARLTETVSLKTEITQLKSSLEASEAERVNLAAIIVKLTPTQKDEFKKIEGIGPKIQELLYGSGIFTFSQLAETPVDRLKEILLAAGDRYRIHDPSTWPKQAKLAADGHWEQLKAWQEILIAGK